MRDGEHPTSKDDDHRRFKYTPEGWGIVQRQPRRSRYIFPYDPKSVCAAFTRAHQILGIEDLRFHDLRHEATSRLFERGYHIHEVAQFTLHESWNELKRYANLRPENVREILATRSQAPAAKQRTRKERETSTLPSGAADGSAPQDQQHAPATVTSDPLQALIID